MDRHQQTTEHQLGKGGEHMIPRLAWSVAEAAEIIGISQRKMFDLIRDGSVHSIKVGGRRLIRHVDLERFVDGLADVA